MGNMPENLHHKIISFLTDQMGLGLDPEARRDCSYAMVTKYK